ncbi:WD40 repeat domain-containing protein [Deinococcus roseus]|uniref:WD40 repeat domain-containing protein n=1 Tax=Deinococcus roseus TaxID=392414 RepID=A0ABQ2D426_9DEIO|nr:WD40 repeat domain-containing protein [Deinococcus roseus]GGJ44673.1 hypothetical protein GCM10008938_33570 [Deinococcus roseus]
MLLIPHLGQLYWASGVLVSGIPPVLVGLYNEALGFSADGQKLLVGSWEEVQIHDLKNHVLISENKHDDYMGSFYQHFHFSKDNQQMMGFGWQPHYKLVDMHGATLGSEEDFSTAEGRPLLYNGEDFAYDPDRKILTVDFPGEKTRFFHREPSTKGVPVSFFNAGHPGRSAFFPTGCREVVRAALNVQQERYAVFCGLEGEIRVFDTRDRKLLHVLRPPDLRCREWVRDMQLSPDGRELGVIHSGEGGPWSWLLDLNTCVYRWDLTQNPPRAHSWWGNQPGAIAFSPDNSVVVVASRMGAWFKRR